MRDSLGQRSPGKREREKAGEREREKGGEGRVKGTFMEV